MNADQIKCVAVIDIGSNSIRMQVSEIHGKSYSIIDEFKEVIRIGDEVFTTGYLSDLSVQLILNVLKVMMGLIEIHNVDVVRAVATESLREAANSTNILQRIEDVCGIKVDIIDGIEEAYYSYLAANYNFQLDKVKAVVVDIGGGSTEFSISEKGKLISSASKKLGCSRLTKKFIDQYPVSTSNIAALTDHIVDQFIDVDESINLVICTGGTMNNIGTIFSLVENREKDASIQYVRRKFLKNLIFNITRMDIESIKKIEGIEEKRADILLAAAMQIDYLLQQTGCDGFYTFSGGLRTGLTIDTLNKYDIVLPFQIFSQDIRFSRLLEIGHKYLFDEQHAMQVCRLSKQLFGYLKSELSLYDHDLKILEAAAMLHDIGNYISYSKHHKHAYYLIMNASLVGYTEVEKNMIAHIARYHRKSVPKSNHELYDELEDKNIDCIFKLAGILRVADALDRSHQSPVDRIIVSDNSFSEECIIMVESNTILFAELQGFEYKKDLLEIVLKKKVVLQ